MSTAALSAVTPPAMTDIGAHWRMVLREGRDALRAAFEVRPDAPRLLREHARLVDTVLRGLWQALQAPADAALVAVGGYGRGQLFPHSDVDVLILLAESAHAETARFAIAH